MIRKGVFGNLIQAIVEAGHNVRRFFVPNIYNFYSHESKKNTT